MLIMRRRPGEAILVGKNIEIQVLEISGGRVKLSINAPEEVAISRKEVRLTKEQNEQAAQGASPVRIAALLDALRRDSPPGVENSTVNNNRNKPTNIRYNP
jgi:carbon storage regulator